MDKIKLLIVDDHHILVDGLKNLFDQTAHIQVIGTAMTGEECRRALLHELPDVILLDISLPDVNGIDLCKEIKTAYPEIKIVALSSFNEYAIVRRMIDQGVSGYVVKNAMPEEIIQSVEMVMQDETFFCEEIDLLLRRRSIHPVWLTPREKELLGFIVEGYTNAEIAEKMFLGVETINSYRKNLLVKMGARNTAVLVRMALEQKLV
ncbi:MAG: response regulator transcription factor [Proteiniphilum sp.]|jgi:DNA-binding NarL/FixJ family response regulator|nr:response regulator transcription factor [Proteiniphilum sp.]NCB24538.1 response regulator transcription factor [Bacteroidia bacterium]MDD2936768.1 response regulator transcription factor [Proteiniphilum sp.]MDD3076102.1 response regulator transcription factor [Proteiniphilum sp.]MDD3778600.1 response regulator transcription factor [Proteiniphilum sp.]